MPTQWVTTIYAEGVVTTDDPINHPIPEQPDQEEQP